jgi:hypothetical protein
MAVKQPMRLFVDICIHDVFYPDEFQVNLLQCAQKRKYFFQLCCINLCTGRGSLYKMQKVLHVMLLEHPGTAGGSFLALGDHEKICLLPRQNE